MLPGGWVEENKKETTPNEYKHRSWTTAHSHYIIAFCICPCCSLVCWALLVFSPPARRGSLDFNRGAGPSPSSPSSPSPACLPLCQLRMLPCLDANCRSQAPVDVDCAWTRSPYPELRRLWSGLGPTTISRAQEAVELDFWPTWFPYLIEKSAIDPRL